MRTVLAIATAFTAGAACTATAQEAPQASPNISESARRLVEQFGDVSSWANATGYRMQTVHISDYARLPYTHETWGLFDERRNVTRVMNQDLRQLRGLNGGDGWWIQEGVLDPYEPDFLEAEKVRWRSGLFRSVHRLASGDPAVTIRRDGDELEIQDGGDVILRIRTDEGGAPVSFARSDNLESWTDLGSFDDYGPIRVPTEIRTPDGRFRSLILEFQLYMSGPDVSFAPPADPNDMSR